MKRVVYSYFLVFLILWPVWRTGLVWAWFKINQDYIAQELCINRDKPELSCAGKCILNSKLNATHSDGNRDLANELEDLFGKSISFVFDEFMIIPATAAELPLPLTKMVFCYQFMPIKTALHAVFRPPIA
jgi:hypothetical protein